MWVISQIAIKFQRCCFVWGWKNVAYNRHTYAYQKTRGLHSSSPASRLPRSCCSPIQVPKRELVCVEKNGRDVVDLVFDPLRINCSFHGKKLVAHHLVWDWLSWREARSELLTCSKMEKSPQGRHVPYLSFWWNLRTNKVSCPLLWWQNEEWDNPEDCSAYCNTRYEPAQQACTIFTLLMHSDPVSQTEVAFRHKLGNQPSDQGAFQNVGVTYTNGSLKCSVHWCNQPAIKKKMIINNTFCKIQQIWTYQAFLEGLWFFFCCI